MTNPDKVSRLDVSTPANGRLTFDRDHQARAKLFVPESFHHQARANLLLLDWIIRTYTQEGETILDPMAGTGSLMIGAMKGRDVILVDLEDHWVETMKGNAALLSNQLFGPTGKVQIYQGDSRDVANIICADRPVQHVVMSPPYWDMFSDWHISSRGYQREKGPLGSAYADSRGTPSTETTQIGNIHIYEVYLRAMLEVYQSTFRILEPGASMIVIVKDRIHKGRKVPITADTETLLRAIGFEHEATQDVQWPLSRYRRLHRQKRPNAPTVDVETVLVYRKPETPHDHTGQAHPIAFVMKPTKQYSPGAAPRKLHEKSLEAARLRQAEICILDDFHETDGFRTRKDYCFSIVADLVAQGRIHLGRPGVLYVPVRYATYIRQRMETLGCPVDFPLEGLNMGQKLRALTNELSASS